MIIAMPTMGMVEVAFDQVVDVIAVRHCRMAAVGGVHVRGIVALAYVARRAAGRIRSIDRDRAFVDVVAVHHMQMPVVQVVDVTAVLNGKVAAVAPMNMIVSGVRAVGRHEEPDPLARAGRRAGNSMNDEVLPDAFRCQSILLRSPLRNPLRTATDCSVGAQWHLL